MLGHFSGYPVPVPLRGASVRCRVSIVLALCLAMAGPQSLSSRPGAGTKDRDRVARLTRTGSFRFDSPEAILHGHEEIKPDAAFVGLVVGQPPSATAPGAAPDTPHAVAVARTRTLGALAGPGEFSAFGLAVSLEPYASSPSARPPGRAPPSTT